MDGIGSIWGNTPVSQIYFNPVYNLSGIRHAAQASLSGIRPAEGSRQPALSPLQALTASIGMKSG